MCIARNACVVFARGRCYRRPARIWHGSVAWQESPWQIARRISLRPKWAAKQSKNNSAKQAELIDKLFIYRFDEMDKRWDAKLDAKLGNFAAQSSTPSYGQLRTSWKRDLRKSSKRNSMPSSRPISGQFETILVLIKDAVRIILTRLM